VDLQFAHPELLLLLLVIPAAAWWYLRKGRNQQPDMRISSLQGLRTGQSIKARVRPWLPLLSAAALVFLIIAMARPQSVSKEEKIEGEGIDIMLVMDLSNSMMADDFKPNRLEVAKRVATEFVDKRPYDRIGLSIFSGEAFTQCPLTTDHRVLRSFLAELNVNMFDVQGTAIGMGLASAVNRLKDSEAQSKVVILLTDGDNNAGYIPPATAADLAKEFNIRVYTIGVGSDGYARIPFRYNNRGDIVYRNVRVEINEELLIQIAEMTGGQYYRAKSEETLERIYEQIDRMEKTTVEITAIERRAEGFHPYLLIGLLLLTIEWVLRQTWLRTLP
jgi:Ca-activated chloride channel family protein